MCIQYTERETLLKPIIAYKVARVDLRQDNSRSYFSQYRPEAREMQTQIDTDIEHYEKHPQSPMARYMAWSPPYGKAYVETGRRYEYVEGEWIESGEPGIFCYTTEIDAHENATSSCAVLRLFIPSETEVAKGYSYGRWPVLSVPCVKVLGVLPLFSLYAMC